MAKQLDNVAPIVSVTPELAAEWLESFNSHNRPFRMRKALGYSRDMQHGKWLFNGDPIRFTGNFEALQDGQHRLWAVVDSGTTQSFVVVNNLPAEAQETVDTGITRTTSDALHLRGYHESGKVAAIARQCVRYDAGVRTSGGQLVPTHAEIIEFVEQNEKLLGLAVSTARHSERTNLWAPPSTIGSAYFICARINQQDAEEFCNTRLIDMIGLTGRDPARALRRRLEEEGKNSGRRTRTRMSPDDVLRYAFLAWNIYRERREVSKLQAPKGGWTAKNFPIPK